MLWVLCLRCWQRSEMECWEEMAKLSSVMGNVLPASSLEFFLGHTGWVVEENNQKWKGGFARDQNQWNFSRHFNWIRGCRNGEGWSGPGLESVKWGLRSCCCCRAPALLLCVVLNRLSFGEEMVIIPWCAGLSLCLPLENFWHVAKMYLLKPILIRISLMWISWYRPGCTIPHWE